MTLSVRAGSLAFPAAGVPADVQAQRHHLDDSCAAALKTGEAALAIQKRLSAGYRALVSTCLQGGLADIGHAPEPFAVVLLGSLASESARPGSDVDYGILLRKASPAGRAWAKALSARFKANLSKGGLEPCRALSPEGVLGLIGTPAQLLNAQVSDWELAAFRHADRLQGDGALTAALRAQATSLGRRSFFTEGYRWDWAHYSLQCTKSQALSVLVDPGFHDCYRRDLHYLALRFGLMSQHPAELAQEAANANLLPRPLADALCDTIEFTVRYRLGSRLGQHVELPPLEVAQHIRTIQQLETITRATLARATPSLERARRRLHFAAPWIS